MELTTILIESYHSRNHKLELKSFDFLNYKATSGHSHWFKQKMGSESCVSPKQSLQHHFKYGQEDWKGRHFHGVEPEATEKSRQGHSFLEAESNLIEEPSPSPGQRAFIMSAQRDSINARDQRWILPFLSESGYGLPSSLRHRLVHSTVVWAQPACGYQIVQHLYQGLKEQHPWKTLMESKKFCLVKKERF